MEKNETIRPSLLSGDFTHLAKDVKEMISLGIKDCHFDVMDGSFVKSISFGEPIFKALNTKFGKKISFDVHLMTLHPIRQMEQYAFLGAKEISIHYEALKGDVMKQVEKFRKKFPDVRIGLAFNPATDVSLVLPFGNLFDYFLVMSVVPGKGGQPFIEGSEEKIARLSEMRKQNHLSFKIMVDGGINENNAALCYKSGADYLVCGSYYFKCNDKKEMLMRMKETFAR